MHMHAHTHMHTHTHTHRHTQGTLGLLLELIGFLDPTHAVRATTPSSRRTQLQHVSTQAFAAGSRLRPPSAPLEGALWVPYSEY
jgi:hypothetical protein